MSSPGQLADGGVDEQSARLRNALQVMLHERQVHFAEGRSSRSRMDVLPQLLLEIVPADLVLNSGNYDLSYQGNNLTITKALLNVIADAKTKVYGDADPSLTYQVSGLKNGDTAGAVLNGGGLGLGRQPQHSGHAARRGRDHRPFPSA